MSRWSLRSNQRPHYGSVYRHVQPRVAAAGVRAGRDLSQWWALCAVPGHQVRPGLCVLPAWVPLCVCRVCVSVYAIAIHCVARAHRLWVLDICGECAALPCASVGVPALVRCASVPYPPLPKLAPRNGLLPPPSIWSQALSSHPLSLSPSLPLTLRPSPCSCPGPTLVSSSQYTAIALTPNAIYRNRMSCQVVVTSPPGSTILLNFGSFDTESGYDFLYLYSASSTSGTLIGKYSGAQLLNSTVESNSMSTSSTKLH